MKDGKILTVDMDRVRREANALAGRIKTSLAEQNR
jgi:hypothetical protein